MFTKNNPQLQSTAVTGINNDRNKNIRIADFSLKGLYTRSRAFLFVALVAFTFLTMSANSAQAQAQQNNYWATDGCFYSHNGSYWSRMCPADQSRTKYYFDGIVNGQWNRLAYVDNSVYSEGGRTFTQNYLYAYKKWVRTYVSPPASSAGGTTITLGGPSTSSVGGPTITLGGPPASSVGPLQKSADIANAPWLLPACTGSINGCR